MKKPTLEMEGGSLWKLLWPMLYLHRFRLGVVFVMMPISSVMAMLLPYLTKIAIDDYIVPATEAGNAAPVMEPLLNLVGLALGVVVVGYVADAIYVSVLQRTGQNLIAQLRDVVYKRTLRLPRSYFDTHPIGSILTRVTSDMEALGESLATGSVNLFVDLLKVMAYLGMMFALNWELTLILLVTAPLLVFFVWFFQSRVRETFLFARQALSEATGFLQEHLAGIKTIQLYGEEKRSVERFRKKNLAFYKAQNSSNLYDALLFSLVEGITTLALALVLWYSGGKLLSGLLTLGVLVAFMEYIQRLFVPVREFAQQIAVMQRAMAALDHINDICSVPLDEAEKPTAGEPRREPFEEIVFENVRFRYGPTAPEILKGISFSLKQGQTMAIVGATGSGKSTLIRLITRGYGGYEGSIRINGRELSTIPASELAGLISVVHQNVFLFGGSVGFNISLDRSHVGQAQVQQTAKYVNAHNFVERQPEKYDFKVIQGGGNISAGEAQLISLARAVAAETDLIVLDEATSSVDSMTESLIQDAVGRLYHDKTVIAIAHRLSTIRNSDTILVMNQGEIAESGSHEELLAGEGIYANLLGEILADPESETPEEGQTG